MTTRTDVPLALTMGDPAGIGPELAIAIWCHRHTNRCPAFALLADPDLIKARAADVGLIAPVALIATASEAAAVFDAALPVLPIPLSTASVAGKPDPANATAVIRAIDQAVSAVANGQASAVVTNPIAKSVLYAAGFSHPGHTEYLAELTRRHWPEQPATPVMMLASSELKVVPLTIHVPLHTVPTLITPDLIMHTVRIMHHALQSDFGYDRPRIAVAGLNPHAGEAGTIGTEDRNVVTPAVAKLRDEGIDVVGPLPADTMFHAEARQRYDAALAMYHDQALIPIKTLAFDTGVNTTLGLPLVRTSPDHGTAFDIAGKGTASPKSLLAALHLAAEMASRRAQTRVYQ